MAKCQVLEKCKQCKCCKQNKVGLSDKISVPRPAERVIERQIVEIPVKCERCCNDMGGDSYG